MNALESSDVETIKTALAFYAESEQSVKPQIKARELLSLLLSSNKDELSVAILPAVAELHALVTATAVRTAEKAGPAATVEEVVTGETTQETAAASVTVAEATAVAVAEAAAAAKTDAAAAETDATESESDAGDSPYLVVRWRMTHHPTIVHRELYAKIVAAPSADDAVMQASAPFSARRKDTLVVDEHGYEYRALFRASHGWHNLCDL